MKTRTILTSALLGLTLLTGCRKEDDSPNYPNNLQNTTYLSYNVNDGAYDGKLKLDFKYSDVRSTILATLPQGQLKITALDNPSYTYSQGHGTISSIDFGNSTAVLVGTNQTFLFTTTNGHTYIMDDNNQVAEIDYIAPYPARTFTIEDNKMTLSNGQELIRE